ncbi:MAG: M48 family metallopeptidase [Leptospiraceae bacterium]|nr:M48 family metallopeptidase [Leptospiraceae bacterium]
MKQMIQFDYRIIRRKGKRNISISVHRDRRVIVTAAKGISDSELKKILESKTPWILKQIESCPPLKKPVDLKDGHQFLIVGKKYELKIIHSERKNVRAAGPEIIIGLNKKKLSQKEQSEISRELLIHFCRTVAREVILQKIKEFHPIIGKEPKSIRIKNCRTKWGSASSRGNLNFNWKIVLAPENVLDYLVLHEMAHLVHQNHSRDFYGLLEKVFPGQKEADAWLKKNGNCLDLIPINYFGD